MTKQGLNELKELATEVEELRDKAVELMTRLQNLYRYEADALKLDAYMRLSYAGSALKDAVPCIKDSLLGLQRVYNAENS